MVRHFGVKARQWFDLRFGRLFAPEWAMPVENGRLAGKLFGRHHDTVRKKIARSPILIITARLATEQNTFLRIQVEVTKSNRVCFNRTHFEITGNTIGDQASNCSLCLRADTWRHSFDLKSGSPRLPIHK